MLAGTGLWKQGDGPYAAKQAGERAHHPSMTPHATRTDKTSFLSAYAWFRDISTDGYVYHGSSEDKQ